MPKKKPVLDKPRQGQAVGQTDSSGQGQVYVRAALERLLSDPTAPAAARSTAARTLAEMDGLIGRHQQAPDRTRDTPIESLSRTELEAELGRLRRACARVSGTKTA